MTAARVVALFSGLSAASAGAHHSANGLLAMLYSFSSRSGSAILICYTGSNADSCVSARFPSSTVRVGSLNPPRIDAKADSGNISSRGTYRGCSATDMVGNLLQLYSPAQGRILKPPKHRVGDFHSAATYETQIRLLLIWTGVETSAAWRIDCQWYACRQRIRRNNPSLTRLFFFPDGFEASVSTLLTLVWRLVPHLIELSFTKTKNIAPAFITSVLVPCFMSMFYFSDGGGQHESGRESTQMDAAQLLEAGTRPPRMLAPVMSTVMVLILSGLRLSRSIRLQRLRPFGHNNYWEQIQQTMCNHLSGILLSRPGT
ncbi:hypothetical protein BC826DRAFT_968815 [Russula brevipes]|nr:hypothetical protein BC826DRAFT_968815 [Russula brevipes]